MASGTGPEIMHSANYCCLIAALEQAGSLDPDKVAAVISNGMKFEGPTGSHADGPPA